MKETLLILYWCSHDQVGQDGQMLIKYGQRAHKAPLSLFVHLSSQISFFLLSAPNTFSSHPAQPNL